MNRHEFELQVAAARTEAGEALTVAQIQGVVAQLFPHEQFHSEFHAETVDELRASHEQQRLQNRDLRHELEDAQKERDAALDVVRRVRSGIRNQLAIVAAGKRGSSRKEMLEYLQRMIPG